MAPLEISEAVQSLQEEGFSEELQLLGDAVCWLSTGQTYDPDLFRIMKVIPVTRPDQARVVAVEISIPVSNPLKGFLIDFPMSGSQELKSLFPDLSGS